jgi:hypothetical protein
VKVRADVLDRQVEADVAVEVAARARSIAGSVTSQ